MQPISANTASPKSRTVMSRTSPLKVLLVTNAISNYLLTSLILRVVYCQGEERIQEANGYCEIAQSGMKGVFCVYSNADCTMTHAAP